MSLYVYISFFLRRLRLLIYHFSIKGKQARQHFVTCVTCDMMRVFNWPFNSLSPNVAVRQHQGNYPKLKGTKNLGSKGLNCEDLKLKDRFGRHICKVPHHCRKQHKWTPCFV